MSVSFANVTVTETVENDAPEFVGYDEYDGSLMFTVSAERFVGSKNRDSVRVSVLDIDGELFDSRTYLGASINLALHKGLESIAAYSLPEADYELRTRLESEGGGWELHVK